MQLKFKLHIQFYGKVCKIHVYVGYGSFHERKSECVKKSILDLMKYVLFFFLDSALCYLIWCGSPYRERGKDNSGK